MKIANPQAYGYISILNEDSFSSNVDDIIENFISSFDDVGKCFRLIFCLVRVSATVEARSLKADPFPVQMKVFVWNYVKASTACLNYIYLSITGIDFMLSQGYKFRKFHTRYVFS